MWEAGLLPLNQQPSEQEPQPVAAGAPASALTPAAACDGQLATLCDAPLGELSAATVCWLLMKRRFGGTARATATSGHMRATAFVEDGEAGDQQQQQQYHHGTLTGAGVPW